MKITDQEKQRMNEIYSALSKSRHSWSMDCITVFLS